jgi:hypothetical protein
MSDGDGKGRTFRVEIDRDPHCESPEDYDFAWKIYSFDSQYTNYRDPKVMGVRWDDRGWPVITDIGLRNKWRAGLLYFLDRRYDHRWRIAEGGDHVGGVLVWEHKPNELPRDGRRRDADSFLRQYNAWADGECYGYNVSEVDEDGNVVHSDKVGDSCCGFIVATGEDRDYFLGCALECVPVGAKVEFDGEGAEMTEFNRAPLLDRCGRRMPTGVDRKAWDEAVAELPGAPSYAWADRAKELSGV